MFGEFYRMLEQRPRVVSTTKRLPKVVTQNGLAYRITSGDGLPVGHPLLPIVTAAGSPYRWHEGDLFTPLTGNYVFDPPWELPTQNYFGGGGTIGGWWRQPNVFDPRQSAPKPSGLLSNNAQLSNQSYVKDLPTSGMGGLIAGQFFNEPLMDSGGRYASGGY